MKKSLTKLSLIFAFSTLIGCGDKRGNKSEAPRVHNMEQIGIFSGLKTTSGDVFDPGRMAGHKKIVFFGTEYTNPSCEVLFTTLDQIRKHYSVKHDFELEPYFIAPYANDPTKNDWSLETAERRNYTVLQADLETVEKIAANFNVSFFKQDAYGDPELHSKYFAIIDGQGHTLFIGSARDNVPANNIKIGKALDLPCEGFD